jgi:hypothetical protein
VDKTSISSQELRELWKKKDYTVLLPSGDGLGLAFLRALT